MKSILFLLLSFFPMKGLFCEAVQSQPLQKLVSSSQIVDLKKIFEAAPFIYSLLALLSIASMVIWLYSLITFRRKDIMPPLFAKQIRAILLDKNYDQAALVCKQNGNLLASLIGVGLTARKLGPQVMIDAMKSEGKRLSTAFWQRLSLLNDIVIIAPMLGLLGTVIGMFYAFYDVNRSIESMNALFDGLGIAVGTTVAGLIVAIFSMMFHTMLKYKVVSRLSLVENEALSLSSLIEQAP